LNTSASTQLGSSLTSIQKFSMFSGQIGVQDPSVKAVNHDEFLRVFSEGSGFTSGCGIEYGSSLLSLLAKQVESPHDGPVTRHDPLSGTLQSGRRLLDVKVRRYTDANLRHHHQDGRHPSWPFESLRSGDVI